jgi:hypothetical protein
LERIPVANIIGSPISGQCGRLNEIEKHPALRLAPEAYGQAIARAGTAVMSEAGQKLDTATQKINRTGDQLAGLIGTMRGRDEQRSWLIYTGLGGFVVALFAGLLGSPYLASVFLPVGMASNVAAIVMNNDRWDAGVALMQTADPQRWNGAVNAWHSCTPIRTKLMLARRRPRSRARTKDARSS